MNVKANKLTWHLKGCHAEKPNKSNFGLIH